MAILDNGRQVNSFSKVFGTEMRDRRFELWLWNDLSVKSMMLPPPETPFLRDTMATLILEKGLDAEVFRQRYAEAFVAESLLEWIEEDAWQCHWIGKLLGMEHFADLRLTWREKSILMIDFWLPIGTAKPDAVAVLKSRWGRQVKKDKKYRKFFAENLEDKLSMLADWADKYAASKDYGLQDELRAQFSGKYSSQVKSVHFPNASEALIFLNQALAEEWAALCFDAIKKRWSQAKYRDNLVVKKKKQCNVVLTGKSLDLLDAFSDKYFLSRSQILEVLIRSEAEQKRYLSEWIKVAKSLE